MWTKSPNCFMIVLGFNFDILLLNFNSLVNFLRKKNLIIFQPLYILLDKSSTLHIISLKFIYNLQSRIILKTDTLLMLYKMNGFLLKTSPNTYQNSWFVKYHISWYLYSVENGHWKIDFFFQTFLRYNIKITQ